MSPGRDSHLLCTAHRSGVNFIGGQCMGTLGRCLVQGPCQLMPLFIVLEMC